jgi:hypothetical protein
LTAKHYSEKILSRIRLCFSPSDSAAKLKKVNTEAMRERSLFLRKAISCFIAFTSTGGLCFSVSPNRWFLLLIF